MQYHPGDSIGVLPENADALVDALLARLGVERGAVIESIEPAEEDGGGGGSALLPHIRTPCSVRLALKVRRVAGLAGLLVAPAACWWCGAGAQEGVGRQQSRRAWELAWLCGEALTGLMLCLARPPSARRLQVAARFIARCPRSLPACSAGWT